MTQRTGKDSEGEASEEAAAGSDWGFPRWAIFFMVPGVAAPLIILAFILRTDFAHDEQRCPFAPRSVQALDGEVSVHEESRSCLDGVEEHRYVIVRGATRSPVGSRRFAPAAFGRGYQWRAELTDAGEVRVHVTNPGHAERMFREGNAEDAAAWERK